MTYYTTQQAHDDITELFDAYYDAKKAGASIPPNKRIESADAIVEQYVEINGKRPPAGVLSRLATYILLDTLTDSHPDKMAREEYPIMSYGQTGRYFERNTSSDDLQYDSAEVVGRTRRSFTTDEGAVWVSSGAILGNKNELLDEADWRSFLYSALPKRDAYIVERTFFDKSTQEEIAEDLGIHRSRISRIL